jgi:cobalt-zinc-cadmium efflux system membrane fusion protein
MASAANYLLKSVPLLLTGAAFFFSCSPQQHPVDHLVQDEFCLTDTIAGMVRLDTARLQPVQNVLQLSGKVTFDEQKVFKIFPMVGGHAAEVKAELGDYVQQGQVLAVIKSGEVAEFEQQLMTAKSALLLAQKNLEVAQDMFSAGLVAEKDLVTARQEKQNAEAGLKRIKEIFNIYSIGKNADYVVKAPASGFIVEKKINADMQVRPDNGDNLFTISNMNEIWVLANVYESDIAKVQLGYEADVTTLSYPDKVFKGKIDKIFNVLDPATRVMKVRVRLDNTNLQLKPEMFAKVCVRYPEDRQLVAVPAESVIFDRSKNYVMVYRKRCDVDTREIKVYKTVGPTTYLLSGLEPGDQVISRYQLLVYDALND